MTNAALHAAAFSASMGAALSVADTFPGDQSAIDENRRRKERDEARAKAAELNSGQPESRQVRRARERRAAKAGGAG